MRVTKDLLAGLLFLGLGAGAVIIASDYEAGTARRMGPGFFPVLLGGVLALLGATVAIMALLRPGPDNGLAPVRPRALLAVLAAVAAFAALIEPAGLIPALAVMIAVGRLGSDEGSPGELFAIIGVLCLMAVLVLVYALGLPLRLAVWPWN